MKLPELAVGESLEIAMSVIRVLVLLTVTIAFSGMDATNTLLMVQNLQNYLWTLGKREETLGQKLIYITTELDEE